MDFKKEKAYYLFIVLLSFVAVFILFERMYVFTGVQTEIKYVHDSSYFGKQYFDIMTRLNTAKVNADDTELVNQLQNVFIEKPSQLPYNFTKPHIRDPSPGQAHYVDNLLKQKTNGFFIECGAFTGERHSNTLFLERYRNWTGILIEVNPMDFKELRTKHRKAYSLNACLSTHSYPSMETLFYEDTWTSSGNIVGDKYSIRGGQGIKVQMQCFPLYSILLALGNPKVDYFSLDIQRAEKGVLESIPWGKVDIQLMSIEYVLWSGGKRSLQRFMEKRGYKYMTEISDGGGDIIVKKQHNYQI